MTSNRPRWPFQVLILPILIHLVAGGQIQDAAEEIEVPPAHRAAPPPSAAAAPPPAAPLGPPLVGSAPPPSYPLFYPAAWLPFGRFSASIPPVQPAPTVALIA
ncbi:hypothetical protein KR009_008592 [Drosophila setifemur]|nr:hypothetical protein KR009_008592 [Drosophila setifemur]